MDMGICICTCICICMYDVHTYIHINGAERQSAAQCEPGRRLQTAPQRSELRAAGLGARG